MASASPRTAHATATPDGLHQVRYRSVAVLAYRDLALWSSALDAGCSTCQLGFFGSTCQPCPFCGANGVCSATTGDCGCISGYNGPQCQYSNAGTCSGKDAHI